MVAILIPIPGLFTNDIPGIGISTILILELVPITIPDKIHTDTNTDTDTILLSILIPIPY